MKAQLDERNRQITLMQQSENKKLEIADSLKQLFAEERRQQQQEMEKFMQRFYDQSGATAARMANMTP